ncbi:transposase [Xanthomonas oryzae pv. oryzae KACC 10331]|uniref:Transposase n=1 Tax=Xanthomonas oryzae pv. oryzae (strain KACC10331 / KXO85) TaxID=291331 RepID=Q5GUT8_XANOR|nr:transposase [Xanthomonas oryzae pv. oryzae KACC 10331]
MRADRSMLGASLHRDQIMAMNRVQFQAGLSLPAFLKRYGNEQQCEQALEISRWPQGFVCPRCAATAHSRFQRHGTTYWQCTACYRQTSLRSGTVMDNSNGQRLHPGADVYSDGLGAFRALEAEHAHTVIEGSGRSRCEAENARWVNVVLSNLKRSLDGAYHAFKFAKYAQRYLAETMWRFNRRFDLTRLVPSLLAAAAASKP